MHRRVTESASLILLTVVSGGVGHDEVEGKDERSSAPRLEVSKEGRMEEKVGVRTRPTLLQYLSTSSSENTRMERRRRAGLEVLALRRLTAPDARLLKEPAKLEAVAKLLYSEVVSLHLHLSAPLNLHACRVRLGFRARACCPSRWISRDQYVIRLHPMVMRLKPDVIRL